MIKINNRRYQAEEPPPEGVLDPAAGGMGTASDDDLILGKFKTQEELQAGYTELEKQFRSDNTLRVPGEDATPEAWATFNAKLNSNESIGLMAKPDKSDPEAMAAYYQTMGRPEKADGYSDFEMHGVQMQSERMVAIKEAALSEGVSDKAFGAIMSKALEVDAATNAITLQKQTDGLKDLNTEWGHAYDQKVSRIDKLLEVHGEDGGIRDALKGNMLPPGIMKFLDSIAAGFGVEGTPLTSELNVVDAPDMSELQAQVGELRDWITSNPPNHPQNKAKVEKLTRLEKEIYKLGKKAA